MGALGRDPIEFIGEPELAGVEIATCTVTMSRDPDAVLEAVAAAVQDVVDNEQDPLSLSARELALVHRFGVYLARHFDDSLKQHDLTIELRALTRGWAGASYLPERSGKHLMADAFEAGSRCPQLITCLPEG